MNRFSPFVFAAALVASNLFAQDTDVAKLQAEADAAKGELASHPTFKKFYDHLKAHPESLATNGPKLAAMMWQEANENKTIRDHAPSYIATLQEVERLAAAGRDTKLALQALDALAAHNADLMPDAKARQMKSRLIADAAKAAGEPRVKPQDRAETREWVEKLLTDAIDGGDEPVVGEMLAAQGQLAKSSTERLDAAVALLAVTDEQLQADRPAIATKLVDHIGELLKNATAAKGKKEATDALIVLKTRVATAAAADSARKTLATQPTDPAANQAVGMHLLVNRGDWKEAILHLALGADVAWKTLAADTIAAAEDGKAKAALAERWAALEKDLKAPSKRIARDLFQEALADKAFVGLPRAAAEQKLKALGPFEEVKVVTRPEKPEVKKPEPVKPKVTGKPKYGPAVVAAPNRKTVIVEHDEQFPPELRGKVTKYDWIDPPKQGEADVGKGALEFKVEETGVLYLFGSWGYQGNNGGGWAEERVMPEGLVAQGWESIGKIPGDDKGGIFRKLVTKGESYRIRVNKYAPPVLFTPLPPEPKKPEAKPEPVKPTSSELRPSVTEKKIALNKPLDLLPLLDFNEDTVRGFFHRTARGVEAPRGYHARIRFPVDLRNCSYDVESDFEFPENAEELVVILPVGAHQVQLAVDGWERFQVTAFTRIRNVEGGRTPHAVRGDFLQPKTSHGALVSVRLMGEDATLTFSLDGKKICEYQGASRELASHEQWSLGSNSLLGLGVQNAAVILTGVRLTVREGEAKLTRTGPVPDPLADKRIKDLPTQSLLKMSPLSATARDGKLLVSEGTQHPFIHGQPCREFLFAHAPSKVVYAIPPKAKYFTAYACCGMSPSVKYIVWVDGKSLFTCENRAITPVLVELPAGAKEMTLEVDHLGDFGYDQSCWAYPAFR